ncbi:Chromosome partition protein Smc [archaeon HR01]|nr:Chromosome partition protein Smc [archaeon HR01]
MVKISRLTIQGFKSFGRRKAQLRFPPGLIVITGPNGGGKSTVVDAVRFALGELSAHNLRASRLSNLLHDSPSEKATSASVTLALENRSREIPVDSDEVIITRRLNMSGESEYMINGRQVSRNEMLTILSAANISPDGLNIVTQGSVVSVAEMDGSELRKVLEDVAGIAGYKKKRDEAQKELQIAEKNLEVANAGTSEVRNRLKQLALERNQLLRKTLLEKYINLLRTANISREIELQRRNLEEVDERINALTSEISEKSDLRQRISEKIEELRGKLAEITSLEAEKSETYSRLYEQLNTERMETTRLSAEISTIESNLKFSSAQKQTFMERAEQLREAASKIDSVLEELDKQIGRLQDELNQVSGELAEKNSQLDTLKKRLESEEDRMAAIIKDVSYLNISEDGRSILLEELERQLGDALNECGRLEESLKAVDSDMAASSAEYERLMERLKAIEDDIGQARIRNEEVSARLEVLAAKLGEVEQRLAEVKALRTNLELLMESGTEDNQGETYLRTLGEYLGGIDKASASLLGDWLNAVVVDEEMAALNLAAQAASYGLSVKIVPAKILSSLKPVRHGDTIYSAISGNVKIVKFDGLAGGVKNIVTEDGLYVDAYGRISVHAGEKNLRDVLNIHLERLRNLQKTVEEAYSQLEIKRRSIAGEKALLEKLLEEKASERSRVMDGLKKLEAGIETLKTRRADAEKMLERYRRRVEELTSQRRKISEDIGSLHPKLEELENVRQSVRRLRQEVSSLANMVGEISSRRNRISYELARLQNERERNISRKNSMMQQAESYLLDLSKFDEKNAGVEERLNELRQKLNTSQAKVGQLTEALKNIVEELRQLRISKQGLEQEIRGLEKELQMLGETISSLVKEEQSLRLERVRLETSLSAMNEKLTSLGLSLGDVKTGCPPLEFLTILEEESREIPVVNQLSPTQYESVIPNYKVRSSRIYELEMERQQILELIRSIDEEEAQAFNRTLKQVSEAFGYFFHQLTGGEGFLVLSNPEDPNRSEVEMMVRFPGKQIRSTAAVSGGEKSVAAISLILALQGMTPAQFYIFDEVDAHLDINHTTKLVNLLKTMSRERQIIVVTLKDAVAEKADELFGVYMVNGVSSIVKTRLEEVAVSG